MISSNSIEYIDFEFNYEYTIMFIVVFLNLKDLLDIYNNSNECYKLLGAFG